MPDFELERVHDGPVFGLDEVGRGPLAGPVVAACVYVPEDAYALPFVGDITDSKKLSHVKLETLYAQITQHFVWSVAEISPEEIDEINIFQASLKAMGMAFNQIDPAIKSQDDGHCLVDGKYIPPDLSCPAQAVVKGDSKSVSIAAASIVAKVTRDRLMKRLHEEHPHYGWDRNVGYPTREHRDAIDAHGVSIHHRRSFGPVKNFLQHGSTSPPVPQPLKSAG